MKITTQEAVELIVTVNKKANERYQELKRKGVINSRNVDDTDVAIGMATAVEQFTYELAKAFNLDRDKLKLGVTMSLLSNIMEDNDDEDEDDE